MRIFGRAVRPSADALFSRLGLECSSAAPDPQKLVELLNRVKVGQLCAPDSVPEALAQMPASLAYVSRGASAEGQRQRAHVLLVPAQRATGLCITATTWSGYSSGAIAADCVIHASDIADSALDSDDQAEQHCLELAMFGVRGAGTGYSHVGAGAGLLLVDQDLRIANAPTALAARTSIALHALSIVAMSDFGADPRHVGPVLNLMQPLLPAAPPELVRSMAVAMIMQGFCPAPGTKAPAAQSVKHLLSQVTAGSAGPLTIDAGEWVRDMSTDEAKWWLLPRAPDSHLSPALACVSAVLMYASTQVSVRVDIRLGGGHLMADFRRSGRPGHLSAVTEIEQSVPDVAPETPVPPFSAQGNRPSG